MPAQRQRPGDAGSPAGGRFPLLDEAGIGFTDLCERPTVRASELLLAEIAAGACRLQGELLCYQPRIAVFSGRGIFAHFARHAIGLARREANLVVDGEWPQRLGKTRLWVILSSSGLASKWHGKRLELLKEIAKVIDG